jgi:hypothetical protein
MKTLLKLYLFSFLLTEVLSLIYGFIIMRGDIGQEGFLLTLVGSLFGNLILTLATIPGIAMSLGTKKTSSKIICYLLIPVLLLIYVAVGKANLQSADYAFTLILIASFIFVHLFFLIKRINKGKEVVVQANVKQ